MNKNNRLLKKKLISIISLDIILLLFYSKNYFIINISLFKQEFFLSIMYTSQFFLILSFLEQIFNDTKTLNNINFYDDSFNHYHLTIIFFIITFPHDKFLLSIKKITLIIQSLFALYCIFKLYNFLKKKINDIVDNLVKLKTLQNQKIYSLILGSPLPILIFSISNYILKMIFFFIQNPMLIIYENIILNIIKETAKNFLFFVLGLILYVLFKDKTRRFQNTNNLEEETTVINK